MSRAVRYFLFSVFNIFPTLLFSSIEMRCSKYLEIPCCFPFSYVAYFHLIHYSMNTHNARDSDDESPLESEEHLKRFFAGSKFFVKEMLNNMHFFQETSIVRRRSMTHGRRATMQSTRKRWNGMQKILQKASRCSRSIGKRLPIKLADATPNSSTIFTPTMAMVVN